MFLNQALTTLKNNNQKITKTRRWVLEQLADIKQPLNPYELIKQSNNSDIDITTIYRNLEIFESLGIVHKIQSLWWYMPCIHNHTWCQSAHDLIICRDCNTIEETHLDQKTKSLLWLSDEYVELSGRCEKCEKKK